MYGSAGEDKVISVNDKEQSHLNTESDEVTCDCCKRHDEPRKVHLAEHVRVFDECFARLVQAFRKVGPEANACEIE